jgi:hypothetical protein
MIVTREFIQDNRTEKGGFTKRQLEVLEVEWPPRHGWQDEVIGTKITTDQAEQFQAGKFVKAKKRRRVERKRAPRETEERLIQEFY